tara:strand:+ start:644 stop:1414 length:771 start_codon:yes stop_codon:yes gene_type:complete
MDPIPNINVQIRDISIPETQIWDIRVPNTIPKTVPVTTLIGTPIVNMPGCVTAHEKSGDNKNVVNDDPKGAKIFCDGTVPSFDPIQYEPENMVIERTAPVPKIDPPKAPEATTPDIPTNAVKAAKCPTEAQELKEPIGTLVEGGTKKIVEYRKVGQECIPIKEDLQIVDQVIKAVPSVAQVTTTASIAVVATAAAAATPLLLKVVKPIVKQIIKRVQKLLGKKPRKLSQAEITANKYRQKRELPPLKAPKPNRKNR